MEIIKEEKTYFDKEKVDQVKSIISKEPIQEAAERFKALADETRLKVAYALLQEELCVCDAADIINASTATTSHHLRQLRKSGIAESRREGKHIFYSIVDEHIKTIIAMAVVHPKQVEKNE